jgi:hypothetical protein
MFLSWGSPWSGSTRRIREGFRTCAQGPSRGTPSDLIVSSAPGARLLFCQAYVFVSVPTVSGAMHLLWLTMINFCWPVYINSLNHHAFAFSPFLPPIITIIIFLPYIMICIICAEDGVRYLFSHAYSMPLAAWSTI